MSARTTAAGLAASLSAILILAAAGTTLPASTIGPAFLERPEGLQHVRLDGVSRGDASGFAVSGAGDVDGDGRGDIVVGAFGSAAGERRFSGATYVLFGKALDAPRSPVRRIGLGDVAPGEGLRLVGRDSHDRSGVSVAGAGDVDGDGLDDIIVGAHFAGRDGEPYAGETVLVFGRTLRDAADAGRTRLRLDALSPREAVTIKGPPGGYRFGWSVASAGDVDRDGRPDLVLGTHVRIGIPGMAAVVFARALTDAAAGDGTVDLAALRPGDGALLSGAQADDFAGLEVAGAGDVDGDGRADVLVGAFGTARNADRRVGAAYVVPGRAIARASRRPDTPLRVADANGIAMAGVSAGDNNGRAVAGAGDVDGDGRADVILGAWGARPGGRTASGEVYLLLGRALAPAARSRHTSRLDLRAMTGRTGVVIRGAEAEDFAGWSVSRAGDVDGDGLGDVLVGAYGSGPSGAAYVLFGAALVSRARADGPAVLDLAALDPADGVRIEGGLVGSNLGFRVASAGDVDADGRADILLGAPYADLSDGRTNAGQTFLVTGAALLRAASSDGVLRLGTPDGETARGRGAAGRVERLRG